MGSRYRPSLRRLRRCCLGAAAALAASSCAVDLERVSRSHNLRHSVQTGAHFDHVVLTQEGPIGQRPLHVYIEGDGIPWHFGRIPSSDPTPKNPIALELMLLDTGPSVYVGRPCSFGTITSPGCNSDVWTFERYSAEVVDSMASVIDAVARDAGHDEVILFGYSGGGALARLLAAEVEGVVAIITIAANLDTEAWTETHGYLPLSGSINPASVEPLAPGIRHLQLLGEKDTVVPPAITASYRAAGQDLGVWRYERYDHRCCWHDEWPNILKNVEQVVRSGSAGQFDDRQY